MGRPALAADEEAWERALYLARREMERRAEERNLPGFYVCSLSCRTIVYKALLTGTQLPAFFTDFRYPEYESAIAVFHQRYSTNTLPSWPLAQPFRLLAHNGEINTLWGNRNAMTMRQPMLSSPVWGRKIERLREVIWAEGSDSASLDNAMELLVRSGRDAGARVDDDDPAGVGEVSRPRSRRSRRSTSTTSACSSRGTAPRPSPSPTACSPAPSVDRNGLRPCRYKVRRDGLVVAGSEVGLVDLDPREVVECGKVGPGRGAGGGHPPRARSSATSTRSARWPAAARTPAGWRATWRRWCPIPRECPPVAQPATRCSRLQRAFGYGFEDLRLVLEPMGGTGADPVWSMGDDTPIPPLSAVPQSLYAYFRQRFAQVTNPPIDSLRESMVMSLRMHLGRRGSPLLERPSYARMLRLEHPILLPEEMAALRNVAGFSTVTLDAVWDPTKGADGLQPALTALRRAAERAARRGAHILVISDRAADERRAPIPMLLAIGAVRQHLVHTGLRARVGLVAEAGDAFDIHHFATLIGYGAEAVHPWLALATHGRAVRRSREARTRKASESAEEGAAAFARGGSAQLPVRGGEGPAQDPLQDGDLHPLLVLRRADLRGARPRPRGDRDLFRRHRVAHRGNRVRGDRRGRAGPARARRIPRGRAGRARCPTTGGFGSARREKTTAGHRRSSWRCSRPVKSGRTTEGVRTAFLAKNGCAAAGRAARPAGRAARATPSLSTRSSRPKRSAAGSSPPPCRSARSRPRRTPRSPSR